MLHIRILKEYKATVLQVGDKGQKTFYDVKTNKKIPMASGSSVQYDIKKHIYDNIDEYDKYFNDEIFVKKIDKDKVTQGEKKIDLSNNIGVFALLFGYMDTTQNISRVKPISFEYVLPFHNKLVNLFHSDVLTVNNEYFPKITKTHVDGFENIKEAINNLSEKVTNPEELSRKQLMVNIDNKNLVDGIFMENIHIDTNRLFKVKAKIYKDEKKINQSEKYEVYIKEENLNNFINNGFKYDSNTEILELIDEHKKNFIIDLFVDGLLKRIKSSNNGTNTHLGNIKAVIISDNHNILNESFIYSEKNNTFYIEACDSVKLFLTKSFTVDYNAEVVGDVIKTIKIQEDVALYLKKTINI